MKASRDAAAERAVVAVVLLTRFAFERVAHIVQATDFYDHTLARLYLAAGDLVDVGPFLAPDLVTWRPSSKRVRIAAASTMADLPLVVVERLVDEAPVLVDASPEREPVAEARQAIADALAKVDALENERKVTIPAREPGLRWKRHEAILRGDQAAATAADEELRQLAGRNDAIILRDTPAALEAVAAARRRLDEVLNPVLPVEEATKRLEKAESALEALTAEQAALPEQVRLAVLAGDGERHVALQHHGDDLPLLIAAATQHRTNARVDHAVAMAAAAEPRSPEQRRWSDAVTTIRQQRAYAALAAEQAAAHAAAPVVRSLRHATGGAA